MPAQLNAVRYKVKDTDDTGIVDTCQTIKFVNDGNTFRFIIGGAYQVGYAVNHHEMDTTMLVMKQVHTLTDKFKAVLTGERGKIQGVVKFRHSFQ